MNATHTDFSLARNWLLQMGKGAALANVTVQYCMTLPREVLQSSEIAAVKRLRSPSNKKYQYFWLNFLTFIRCIFTTNLLPHSLAHSSPPSLTYSLSPVTIELINLWLASFFLRASGDYILSKDNWKIGITSLMASSLGLVPFKNVFWSSKSNPGNG